MNDVFIDTSAWFAAANIDSRDHGPVVAMLRAHRRQLLTSNFVSDETITLSRPPRLAIAVNFGDTIRGGKLAQYGAVEPQDEDAAWDIFVRYHDHVFSFIDCTSFAIMRRLGLTTAVSLDEDFRTFGFHCLP